MAAAHGLARRSRDHGAWVVAVQVFGDELRAPAERAHDAVRVARRVPPLLCLDDAPQQDRVRSPVTFSGMRERSIVKARRGGRQAAARASKSDGYRGGAGGAVLPSTNGRIWPTNPSSGAML